MKVVRWCTALAFSLVSSGIADAQLPGLPYSPSTSGIEYFAGPYGPWATARHPGGVYCNNLYNDLRYGFLWVHFLSPVAPNNATPVGYSYSGLVAVCSPLGGPNSPPSDPPTPSLPDPPTPPLPDPPAPSLPDPPVVTPPVLEPHVTPEPATWVLLGTGLVAILGFAALKSTRI